MDATIAFNRQRYNLFNIDGDHGLSWSLIARMRADSDALSPRANASVRRFAAELNGAVTIGMANAVGRGELSASTPVEDLVLQMVGFINSAGPITQDAASFGTLERIYRAFLRTTLAAYGQGEFRAAAAPAAPGPTRRSRRAARGRSPLPASAEARPRPDSRARPAAALPCIRPPRVNTDAVRSVAFLY